MAGRENAIEKKKSKTICYYPTHSIFLGMLCTLINWNHAAQYPTAIQISPIMFPTMSIPPRIRIIKHTVSAGAKLFLSKSPDFPQNIFVLGKHYAICMLLQR